MEKEIIIGTNEEFLLGFKVLTNSEDGSLSLSPSFSNHSHMGSIRQVAVNGKFLVSGGTDEVIRIFNLQNRTEQGLIMEHEGTISSLRFHSNYLFSGADDGKICIYHKRRWECEKTLLGHRSGVTGISIHPSGKLALSVSKDKTLRTWNLIKGRKAYITNVKAVSDIVQWSPDGNHYVLSFESHIDVYDVTTAMVIHSIDVKERINSIVFISETMIAVGGEDSKIRLYDIISKEEVVTWTAHSNRIKAMALLSELEDEEEESVILVSCSSDGYIRLWQIQKSNLKCEPKKLTEVDTTCRPICMAVRSVKLTEVAKTIQAVEKKQNVDENCVDDSSNIQFEQSEDDKSDDNVTLVFNKSNNVTPPNKRKRKRKPKSLVKKQKQIAL